MTIWNGAPGRRRRLGALTILIGLVSSVAAAQEAETPPELRPYRVLVSAAFASDGRLAERSRDEVRGEIARAADRVYGQMWTPTVRENRWLLPADPRGLERLTAAEVRSHIKPAGDPNAEPEFDKVFVLAVSVAGAKYTVAGREWDAVSRSLGPTLTAETWDRRAVGATAFELLTRLFRPTATIVEVGNDVDPPFVLLQIRAGELTPSDPQQTPVREGDLLAPLLRYRSRETRQVEKIQPLDWTYITVDHVARGDATGLAVSGLRSPLGGRRSRLVERAAVRVRPYAEQTRLTIVPGGNEDQPLVAHFIDIVPKLLAREEPQTEPRRVLTDRTGTISLPADADRPLAWLYVRSGEAVLARVPYVAGVESQVTLALPDDSIRLSVEGDLALLQGDLVDTVARRATLLALAKRSAEKGEWDKVPGYFAEVEKLPGVEEFRADLTAIRVAGVEEANRAGDRSAARRIQRLCGQTGELIDVYLSEEKLRVFREGIDELRKAQGRST
ncbi:MAG: hypothetical protein ACREJB_17905 [Planctomycetaceae bacterium]